MIRVRVVGAKDLADDIQRAGRRLPSELVKKMRRATELTLRYAKEKRFKGSRTRALYQIKGGKRVKRKNPRPVTAPPGILGVFEGTYRSSLTGSIRRKPRGVRSIIGPGVRLAYPIAHELGLNGMPKRPVLEPSIDENVERIERVLGTALEVIR